MSQCATQQREDTKNLTEYTSFSATLQRISLFTSTSSTVHCVVLVNLHVLDQRCCGTIL